MKKLLISLTPLVAYVAFATVPVASQAVICKPFKQNLGKVPHYCANAVKLEEYPAIAAEKTPVISWAKLALGGATGVQCKNVVGGNVWNPDVSGTGTPAYPSNTTGQGEQETLEFTTYECLLPGSTCGPGTLTEARVIAENLPWTGVVREGDGNTTLRLENNGVRVTVGCFLDNPFPPNEAAKGQPAAALVRSGGPGTPKNGANFGQLKPGANKCNGPSTDVFGPAGEGSGELEQEKGNGNAGEEGQGKLLYQTNGSDVKAAEPGTGTGVKAITTGTVKTCGFTTQETINVEEP